jgi:hypothetical protein
MQHHPYNAAGPGFLGVSHRSFRPEGDGKPDMVLNGITLDRLADRKALLTGFDQFRRDVDASGLMTGLDTFNEQAFGMMVALKGDVIALVPLGEAVTESKTVSPGFLDEAAVFFG